MFNNLRIRLLPGLLISALLLGLAGGVLPALAQEPGQTPAPPAATPTAPPPTPTAPAATPAPTPVAPAPTQPPAAAPTPTPATAAATVAPSLPTLAPDLRFWAPIVSLHFSRTAAAVGEPVTLTLAANNSSRLPDMRLLLVIQVPSGMSLSGDSLERQGCTGQCSALFHVPSGAAKEFQLQVVAAEVGSLEVAGHLEWSFPDPQGKAVPPAGSVRVSDRLRVTPPATATPTTGPPEQAILPQVYISAPRTVLAAGEEVTVSADLSNPIFSAGSMETSIRIEIPPGWAAWGSDFAGDCSAVCVGNFIVARGGAKTVLLNLRPNQAGDFRLQAEADWRVQGSEDDPQGTVETLEFTVLPAAIPDASGLSPAEPQAPAPPAREPPAQAPQAPPAPPAPASGGGGGGGGCSAPAQPGGPAGLAMPLGMLGLSLVAIRRRLPFPDFLRDFLRRRVS